MLIAADDALASAADTGHLGIIPGVDKKFRNAIDLLSDFAKDFPPKDPTLNPNIGGDIAMKINVKSNSPLTILQALKNNLDSNVTFPSVSLSLNADES